MKKENVVLPSSEPVTDGGRAYNIIYVFGDIIGFLAAFIAAGFNFGIGILGLGAGALFSWWIKGIICEIKCGHLREMTFACVAKMPYTQLIQGMQPSLIPLGMVIEKGTDGNPVITYKGFIYDVSYCEENTFNIWWRKSVARAFLSVRSYIYYYRMASIAYGIIAYHVQQLCSNYSSEHQEAEQIQQEKRQETQEAEQVQQETKQEEQQAKHAGQEAKEEMQEAGQAEQEAKEEMQEAGQAEQEAKQKTQGTTAKYCPKCGTPCKENYKFCIKCGAALMVSESR